MKTRSILLGSLLLLPAVAGAGKDDDFGTSYERDEYAVGARGTSAGVGERGKIIITVTAKGGFEIDEAFKHGVSAKSPPANAEWGQKKLGPEDAWISEDGQTLTFEMTWRATRVGEYPLKVKVKTRVCDGMDCKKVSKTVSTKVYAR